MGTWSNKLYDDDDAQDARDSYKDLLAKGIDGPAATDRFLKLWKSSLKDSDDGPIVWFVLADTQWTLGRLEDRVRDKAVALIDDESSLDRWREQGPKAVTSRRKVLAALKERLLSPQPPRKVFKVKTPTKIGAWKRGELFAYRLRSDKQVVLCLEEVQPAHHAHLSALDWIGDEPPPAATLKTLARKTVDVGRRGRSTFWGVAAERKRDVPYDRMTRLEVRIKPAPPEERDASVKTWARLDETLEEFFGWK
jgi:hypothetical protein